MLVPLIPIAVVCSVGFIASIVKLIGNKRDKAVVGLQHEQTQRRLESTLFINNIGILPPRVSCTVVFFYSFNIYNSFELHIEYVFLHSPDRAGIQDAAIEFCSLKGSEMGVTVQNFKDCVNPIVTSLHRKYNGLETENVTLGPTIWERHQLTGQGTESQTSVTEQQPDPQTKQTTTEVCG